MRFFANTRQYTSNPILILAAFLVVCTLTTTASAQSDPFNEPLRPAFTGLKPSSPQAAPGNSAPPIEFNDLRSPFPTNAGRLPTEGNGVQRSILQQTDSVDQAVQSRPETPAFDRSPSNFPPINRPAQPQRDFSNATAFGGTTQQLPPADSAPQVSPEAFKFSDRLPHEPENIRQVSATEPVQEFEAIADGTQPIGSNPNQTLTAQQSGGFQAGGGFQSPTGEAGGGFRRPAGGGGGGRGAGGGGGGRGFQQGGGGFQQSGTRRGPGPATEQSFGDSLGNDGQPGSALSPRTAPKQQTQFPQTPQIPATSGQAASSGLGAPGQPIRQQPISRETIQSDQPADATAGGSPFGQPANPANLSQNNFGRNQGRTPAGNQGSGRQNPQFNQAGSSAGQNPFGQQNNRANNNAPQRAGNNSGRAVSSRQATPARVNTSVATSLLQPYSLDQAPQPLPGTPVSMQQMLQSTASHDRAKMVGYYWATYRDWCKMHCSVNYFNALKKLNGSNQIDQSLLATAQSAAQNEMLEAEIQLAKSQSQLQRFIPNGQAQPVLPLPSDLPYTTEYTTHYEYFSSNRVLSSDIRNIATSLPKMLELVTRKADTVRASKKGLEQTQGRGQMTQSLQAASMWNDANKEFVDSVIDYNRAIAAYSLSVMSPYKPIEQVASALTETPSTNRANGNPQQGGTRQATLPGFPQGSRTPSPDTSPAFTGAPGQAIPPRTGGAPIVQPQFRTANQSFSDAPGSTAAPVSFEAPAGNPGFQTQPGANGAPASFGRGFGGGFRQ